MRHIDVDRGLMEKAMLLISKDNPLIQKIMHHQDKTLKEAIEYAYGLSQETLKNWIRGDSHKINGNKVEELCSSVNNAATKTKHEFVDGMLTPDDFLESLNKYKFGKKFGFNWLEVQQVIDETTYTIPLPGSGLCLSERDAEILEEDYQGLYKTFHMAAVSRLKIVQFYTF